MPDSSSHPNSYLAAIRVISTEVGARRAQEILDAINELLCPFGNILDSGTEPYWKFPGTHEITSSLRLHPQYAQPSELIFDALGSPWDYSFEGENGVWNAGDQAQFFIDDVRFVWLAIFDERSICHDTDESLAS